MNETRPVLNPEEAAVMDHILDAMRGIQSWGLAVNGTELTMAIHVLQGFVIAHMLQRIAPGTWSAWFKETREDACSNPQSEIRNSNE